MSVTIFVVWWKISTEPDEETEPVDLQVAATGLLERALRIGHEKGNAEWLHNSAVKAQMKRMDPSFSEKSLGFNSFRSFDDFLRSRSEAVDLDESSTTRMVRLRTDAWRSFFPSLDERGSGRAYH